MKSLNVAINNTINNISIVVVVVIIIVIIINIIIIIIIITVIFFTCYNSANMQQSPVAIYTNVIMLPKT